VRDSNIARARIELADAFNTNAPNAELTAYILKKLGRRPPRLERGTALRCPAIRKVDIHILLALAGAVAGSIMCFHRLASMATQPNTIAA
jgi:hypothetical protein